TSIVRGVARCHQSPGDEVPLRRHGMHGCRMICTSKPIRKDRQAGLTVMNDKRNVAPDSTAARVASWRALHVEADAPPHVLKDQIGLELLAPRTLLKSLPLFIT